MNHSKSKSFGYYWFEVKKASLVSRCLLLTSKNCLCLRKKRKMFTFESIFGRVCSSFYQYLKSLLCNKQRYSYNELRKIFIKSRGKKTVVAAAAAEVRNIILERCETWTKWRLKNCLTRLQHDESFVFVTDVALTFNYWGLIESGREVIDDGNQSFFAWCCNWLMMSTSKVMKAAIFGKIYKFSKHLRFVNIKIQWQRERIFKPEKLIVYISRVLQVIREKMAKTKFLELEVSF